MTRSERYRRDLERYFTCSRMEGWKAKDAARYIGISESRLRAYMNQWGMKFKHECRKRKVKRAVTLLQYGYGPKQVCTMVGYSSDMSLGRAMIEEGTPISEVKRFPVCCRCEEPVQPGEYVRAEARDWHERCRYLALQCMALSKKAQQVRPVRPHKPILEAVQ